jgi:hypothetical protein
MTERLLARAVSPSAEFAARIQRETIRRVPIAQEAGFRPED